MSSLYSPSQLDLPGPSILRTKYTAFLLATALIWTGVGITVAVGAYSKRRAQQRGWRMYRFWSSSLAIVLVIAYLAVLTRLVVDSVHNYF